MEAVPEAPDESSGNSTLIKSEDGSPRHEGGCSSPPPNCAICLGRCRNKSFTDSCLHQFCFKCLLTWSRVKTECPLCKQNFKSIIHNVKSNHQYEEYPVQQPQNEDRGPNLDINEIVNAARRFRYSLPPRTTLTLPRRETLAIQQFLMHYPLAALVDMPRPGSVPGRDRPRRSPADFRRTVYRHNLWARPLPDFTGRFRDCTPTFFRYNDSQIHRLMPWLNRELYYLLNENTGHITYVMARILELLPEHPIISPEFRAAVHCYFGERTDHFLHEFHCFASTPYDITGYDRHVQYQTDARVSGLVSEVLSSSDSDSRDSDIVMVSSSHAPGPSRPGPPPAPEPAVIPIETISHSDSDSGSSEVMVVGYIKPPHQRTPELVDLLGSDSDVVVQEDTPPPVLSQLAAPEPPADRTDALVKIKLSLQRSPPSTTESESEQEAYTPPLRRKRSRRAPSDAGSFKPSDDSSSSSFTSSFSSSSSEYESRKRRPRKRSTRTSARGSTRSKKRSTRPRKSKKKSEEKLPVRQGSRKGKSTNGKNVKKSSAPTEVTEPPAERTSATTSRKRKSSTELSDRQKNHESKRLKSVVRVMKRISDSGSGAGTSKTEAAEDSAEAYASSTSPVVRSSRSPLASLSRSHEAAGLNRSYEVAGSSRSYEAAGTSRSHEADGSSKSHEVSGSSKNHETAGLSRSREAAGSSRSHEAAGWSSSHEAASTSRSQEAPGLSRSHEAAGLSRSHEITGLSRNYESAAFSVRPAPRSSHHTSPPPTWGGILAAGSSRGEETACLSKNRGSGSSKSRSNRSQGAGSSRGHGARSSKNHTTDKVTSSTYEPPKAKLLDAVDARIIARNHYTKKESMNTRDSSSSDDNIPLSRSFKFVNSVHSD